MNPPNLRQTAFAAVVASRRGPRPSPDRTPVDAIFGANVFGPDAMRQSLDPATRDPEHCSMQLVRFEDEGPQGRPVSIKTHKTALQSCHDFRTGRKNKLPVRRIALEIIENFW